MHCPTATPTHRYQYYFDRQGAIQDATFKEIGALSRLLELTILLDPPLEARRRALQLLRTYARCAHILARPCIFHEAHTPFHDLP